jgi:hypothetical protein
MKKGNPTNSRVRAMGKGLRKIIKISCKNCLSRKIL